MLVKLQLVSLNKLACMLLLNHTPTSNTVRRSELTCEQPLLFAPLSKLFLRGELPASDEHRIFQGRIDAYLLGLNKYTRL